MIMTHIFYISIYVQGMVAGDGGANGGVGTAIGEKVRGVHKVEKKPGDVKEANEDGGPSGSDLANNKS